MNPVLLHIYGPLAIHSYGAAIAVGLSTFLWLLRNDKRLPKLVNLATFNNIVTAGIFAGIIGGRVLYIMSGEWQETSLLDAFMPWVGGFSILGTVLGLAATLPVYIYYLGIPVLPLLDLAALYGPLLQSISRLGCFFAGCCYGKITQAPWAVTYKNAAVIAPCHIPLHPTQLYSSITLLSIFFVLYFVVQQRCSKPGQLMCWYLIGIGIERFLVDFWRADRIFSSIQTFNILSIHQWIAGGIVIGGCCVLAYLSMSPSRNQI